jgi:hypothetical protein
MKRQHKKFRRGSAGAAQNVVVADNHGGSITRLASFCQCDYSGYRVCVSNESAGCVQRLQDVAVDEGRPLAVGMCVEAIGHCALRKKRRALRVFCGHGMARGWKWDLRVTIMQSCPRRANLTSKA